MQMYHRKPTLYPMYQVLNNKADLDGAFLYSSHQVSVPNLGWGFFVRIRFCPAFLGREYSSRRPLPEIVICSSHYHHAVIGSYFLPEIFHRFDVALQGILTDYKEDRGLHLQEGIVNILQEQREL